MLPCHQHYTPWIRIFEPSSGHDTRASGASTAATPLDWADLLHDTQTQCILYVLRLFITGLLSLHPKMRVFEALFSVWGFLHLMIILNDMGIAHRCIAFQEQPTS